ncbi:RNA polymerase sigma factor [Paraburkholderia caledonica]|uniref:RNA polymerase sigma factor n=1 Tax=Paraburkholderia caledonica TaxID=134536 RepID=UPI0038BA7056
MPTADAGKLHSLLPGMLPRLWAFSVRLCRNRHDAERVLEHACARGLERADQLEPRTAPLSWMFSIIHSTWIDELRTRKLPGRSIMECDDDFSVTLRDSRESEPGEGFDLIIAAVDRLPESQRIVMLLVAVEGLSYSQVAEVVGVPIGTVMSRLSRARQTIGAQFTQHATADARSLRTGRATQ